MEEKLRMRHPRHQNGEVDDLCLKIGREVGYIPLATMHSNIEDLKERYRHKDFATVASLFEKDHRRHVKDMKHHVVIYEEVIELQRAEPGEGQPMYKKNRESPRRARKTMQMNIMKKKKMVKKPIALNELFNPRSLKEGVAPSEIRKMLLYGNPGSGKTCISKVIAHQWASREMTQDFKAVYVVPIRTLNEAKSRGGEWATLERAISKIYFSKRRHIECEDLASQADDDLDLSTTLLILDGLDEANIDIREMISDAEKRACKILMLTRPYNLKDIETRVDIKVECLGFNDEQLTNFLKSELSPEKSHQLIRSLRETPTLWEMAHVPVTANILCSLSTEHGMAIEAEGKRPSMFQIYNDMTEYVWKRFKERPVASTAKQTEVFDDLEKIAFEALQEGLIQIEERFVLRHAATSDVADLQRKRIPPTCARGSRVSVSAFDIPRILCWKVHRKKLGTAITIGAPLDHRERRMDKVLITSE